MISSRAKQKNPAKQITRKGAKRSPPPPSHSPSHPAILGNNAANNTSNPNLNNTNNIKKQTSTTTINNNNANNNVNSKALPRQTSEPHQTLRRKSATMAAAVMSNERINLISAGIFALKNKSLSNAVLTTTTSGNLQAQSTVQSQSSTDLVIFDNPTTNLMPTTCNSNINVNPHQNGGPHSSTITTIALKTTGANAAPATTTITATSINDFDLIQINEMRETGFQAESSTPSGVGGGGGGGVGVVAQVGKSKPPLVTQKSTTTLVGTKSWTSKAGVSVGGASVKVKKKSRAQKAMNVFKTQTSTSASNKEKKVTKTLAIVLIVFLVCW